MEGRVTPTAAGPAARCSTLLVTVAVLDASTVAPATVTWADPLPRVTGSLTILSNWTSAQHRPDRSGADRFDCSVIEPATSGPRLTFTPQGQVDLVQGEVSR